MAVLYASIYRRAAIANGSACDNLAQHGADNDAVKWLETLAKGDAQLADSVAVPPATIAPLLSHPAESDADLRAFSRQTLQGL